MWRFLLFVWFLVGMLLAPSHACSFQPGYEPFLIRPYGLREEPPPQPPKLEVLKIERGRDGNPGMCDDAGILVLGVKNDSGQTHTGYRFRLVSGVFNDRVFPDYAVRPAEQSPGVLRFVWLDGASDRQEPIDLVVEVVAVSLWGAESDAVRLHIKHPGR